MKTAASFFGVNAKMRIYFYSPLYSAWTADKSMLFKQSFLQKTRKK
jgi:hypothetical protein